MKPRSSAARSILRVAAFAAVAGGFAACGPRQPASTGPSQPAAAADRVARSLARPYHVAGRPVERFGLEERMAVHRVPGVSVAVVEDGELAWARAWGVKDAEDGAPVTTETLFQAASISKPVAVMGMLRLVEDGRLDLDAPVDRYLRSWAVPGNPFDEPVTLRRLASHTAGTTVHGFPGYERDAEIPGTVGVLNGDGNTDAVVVDVEPGSTYRYSGGGTTILQLVVEDVTGRPFDAYMADAILEPAGMTRSTYAQPLPPARRAEAASAHRGDGTPLPGDWHVYPEKAAAGLWTTPTDLARLVMEVQRALEGASSRLVSREMAERMLTPVREGYGLGWGTAPGGRFGHGGSNAGFRAIVTAFRDGRAVIVMTNGDRGGALYPEIVAAVGAVHGWDELAPETLTPADLTAPQRDAIAGTYRIAAMDAELTLTSTPDGLFRIRSPHPSIPETELVAVSATELVDPGDGTRLTVEWDGDRVVGIRVQGLELTPVPAR